MQSHLKKNITKLEVFLHMYKHTRDILLARQRLTSFNLAKREMRDVSVSLHLLYQNHLRTKQEMKEQTSCTSSHAEHTVQGGPHLLIQLIVYPSA